jgi:hypothetical protein
MSFLSGGIEELQSQKQIMVNGVVTDVFGQGLSGTTSIASGGTSVTVSHSLGMTPRVLLEILSNLGSRACWVSGKTATQFVINVGSAAPSGGLNFGWRVTP